jgi:aminoglycoside 3-N-acetyltransferase
MDRGHSRTRLTADLRSLGLRVGQNLLVHCSLGQVRPDGGPATLLGAIRDVTGPAATLVVPAQTTWNSVTSRVFREATAHLDEAGRARHFTELPAFDPLFTPSSGMGLFAEYVRTQPGAARSAHPQSSFAAIGPRAADAMSTHDLNCHLGERSPLGWLYDTSAAILLLGVGYSVCTAFHLAEYRLRPRPRRMTYDCFTVSRGARVKRKFRDIELDDSDFGLIGDELDLTDNTDGARGYGVVGSARSKLVPLREAVHFATSWMNENRKISTR